MGEPEREIGGQKTPAVEPNWKEVSRDAQALLARTHDLRVLVHLAIAELNLGGVPAFAAVLDVTAKLLETQWAHVHPQLDPDDDDDPTLRSNALYRLADPAKVLRPLRDLPLIKSKKAGALSWRDIAAAAGGGDPLPGRERLGENVVRGGFQDADPAQVAALRDGLVTALAAVAAIPAVFPKRGGASSGPNLAELSKLLIDIQRYVERFAPQAADAPADEPVEDTGVDTQQAAAAPRAGGASVASLSAVTTRADAIRLLDLVAEYYQRYEPSSPLPLLLERARRLADKNFIDILRDLAPDGVNQAQIVTGVRDE